MIQCGRGGWFWRGWGYRIWCANVDRGTGKSELHFLDSIVVSIPACHAGDPGSIPGRGVVFILFLRPTKQHLLRFSSLPEHSSVWKFVYGLFESRTNQWRRYEPSRHFSFFFFVQRLCNLTLLVPHLFSFIWYCNFLETVFSMFWGHFSCWSSNKTII